MRNLFKMEFLRHRDLAFGFGLLHLLVLYYLLSLDLSFLLKPVLPMWMLGMIVLTAAFAIYQMSLHRRTNDWLYLLHRPLHTKRIFLALALAGLLLAAIMVLLPAALMLIVMDIDGLYGIEARHYQVLPYVSALILTTYFCGCFAVFSASRLKFFVLIITIPFFMAHVESRMEFAAPLLILLAFALALVAFKPDHSRQPDNVSLLALTELPIQCGGLWLFVAIAMLFVEITWILGNDPLRSPAPGTDYHVLQLPPKERMQLALQQSSHPEAAFLSQQVTLGEISAVTNPTRFTFSYPRRHQLPFTDRNLVLTDPDRNVRWTFSFEAMLFEGRDPDSGARLGWLGPQGFQSADQSLPPHRFSSIPWAANNAFIINDHHIYQIDWKNRQLALRYDKSTDKKHTDRFKDSLTLSENLGTLISETSLYIFSTAEFRDPNVKLQPRAVLTLPSNDNPDLRSFHVLELIDGFLVSAVTDISPSDLAPDFAWFNKSQLLLYRIRSGFDSEMIASVALPSTYSELFIYKDFIAAPGIRVLTDMFTGFHLEQGAARTFTLQHARLPGWVWAATALNCALCASIVALLLRRSLLSRRIKIFWIVCTALPGLAGLFSFFVGNYWRGNDQFISPTSKVLVHR